MVWSDDRFLLLAFFFFVLTVMTLVVNAGFLLKKGREKKLKTGTRFACAFAILTLLFLWFWSRSIYYKDYLPPSKPIKKYPYRNPGIQLVWVQTGHLELRVIGRGVLFDWTDGKCYIR